MKGKFDARKAPYIKGDASFSGLAIQRKAAEKAAVPHQVIVVRRRPRG